jgi:hypothetical protein
MQHAHRVSLHSISALRSPLSHAPCRLHGRPTVVSAVALGSALVGACLCGALSVHARQGPTAARAFSVVVAVARHRSGARTLTGSNLSSQQPDPLHLQALIARGAPSAQFTSAAAAAERSARASVAAAPLVFPRMPV